MGCCLWGRIESDTTAVTAAAADCSPPGSPVHGISQARILEWVPFPSPGDLPNSGIEPTSPALAGRFFTREPPEKPSLKEVSQSLQLLTPVRLSATPRTAARQASLSITSSHSLIILMCIESVMPSSHLILCHPLLLLSSIFRSIRVFSNESILRTSGHQKYWSFSFSISPSSEYSGLVSFRMNWLHLLAVQGTLKSLLQHHSSKASFFGAQLSL